MILTEDLKVKLQFSSILAIILIILFFTMSNLFNLFYFIILLPITLIHEMTHYFFAILLLPEQNPKLVINIANQITEVRFDHIPVNWKSAIISFMGPFLTIVILTVGIIINRGKKSKKVTILKIYFLISILIQFSQLIPILPIHNDYSSDGFRIYEYLHLNSNFPAISEYLSLNLYILSVIIFFSTFWLVGLIFYYFLIILCDDSI